MQPSFSELTSFKKMMGDAFLARFLARQEWVPAITPEPLLEKREKGRTLSLFQSTFKRQTRVILPSL
jgi:hypothetical protein